MVSSEKNSIKHEVFAGRDARTKLLSRERFYRDVDPLVSNGKLLISSLTLMVIDIKGFDFILRTFGPYQRDIVIEQVACRIQQAVGDKYMPYHITQHRFALTSRDIDLSEVEQMADELLKALQEPFQVSGVAYNLEPYVGLSFFPDNASSVSELVRTAVFACDKARASDECYMLYEKDEDVKERDRFYLLLDLEKALSNDSEIEVAYQPQINISTGEVYGVEALCRWRHPTLGIIPPGDFLPFVEHSPLIMPLTETILRKSLQDMVAWDKFGFTGNMAINLSTRLFGVVDMRQRLKALLANTKVSPSRIHFEITETGIMERLNHAVEVLCEFKEAGYGIAIDDFGTGHSSLAYIGDLPADIIKIDMHFVQNMDKAWGKAIVGVASVLAENLNLKTCAEGIETEAQLQACHELGVSIGQGYFIGRPMFKAELESWFANRLQRQES
ncbi:MAG: GGDEF domain-containing phosphodiesterase [Idiomarina sp.]